MARVEVDEMERRLQSKRSTRLRWEVWRKEEFEKSSELQGAFLCAKG